MVFNSRGAMKNSGVWRRRRCQKCEQEFTTRELVELDQVIRVAGSGAEAAFSHTRFLMSLLRVWEHRPDHGEGAHLLALTIERKLIELGAKNASIVTREEIIKTTLSTLKNFDAAAYMKYLAAYAPPLNMHGLRNQLKS